MKELRTTIFVDSNHGHDKVTSKSITGLIRLVGSTPTTWFAKRQSSCQTSTFSAEFISLKRAVEEAITHRHYLRAFGVRMLKPTTIYEDDMSVVINLTTPGSKLQKKHVALACHFCREYQAGGVVNTRKIKSENNYSDGCTKTLASNEFNNCFCPLMSN